MNQTALLSIAVAAGFGGGFLGSILMAPAVDSDSSGLPGDGNPALEASLGNLETRMLTVEASADALELSVGVLDGRYEDLASLIPANQPGGAEGGDGSALSLAAADMPTGGGFDAAVAAVIEQREAAEAAQRDADRQQRRDDAMQRRVDDLAEQLNLDPGQKTQFADVLAETAAKQAAMWTEMRDGNLDRESIREAMTTLRDEETAAMSDFLNDDQLTKYQEVGSTSGFGGRGGQRGGGGTGGTGGGGGGRGGF